jgi:maleylacetate reductase
MAEITVCLQPGNVRFHYYQHSDALGGTGGITHGFTSCVMLPHVLRFNRPVNTALQAWGSEALGRPGDDAADCRRAPCPVLPPLPLRSLLRQPGAAIPS